MAYTMFLDIPTWDITVDHAGNISMIGGGYAVAQNVANAVRLFTRDAYFDQDKGVPHFSVELGHLPPVSLIHTHIMKAVMSVDEVASAEVKLEGVEDRKLTGNITLTTTSGDTANVDI